MYGLLVLSLVLAKKQSGLLYSGLAFATLLCMKHIYIYLAPAYFVFLLRTYCLSSKSMFRIQWLNCIKLGGGIGAILAVAFGPFALKDGFGQLWQIWSRLMPFERGLCHSYWAPNIWALYSFADRVLLFRKYHRNHTLSGHLLTTQQWRRVLGCLLMKMHLPVALGVLSVSHPLRSCLKSPPRCVSHSPWSPWSLHC